MCCSDGAGLDQGWGGQEEVLKDNSSSVMQSSAVCVDTEFVMAFTRSGGGEVPLLAEEHLEETGVIFGDHGSLVTCMELGLGEVFSAGRDGVVKVWTPGQEVSKKGLYKTSMKIHNAAVCSMSISSSKPLLVSGAEDCTVRLWDIEANTSVSTLPSKLSKPAVCLQMSPDGRLVTFGAATNLVTWDLRCT